MHTHYANLRTKLDQKYTILMQISSKMNFRNAAYMVVLILHCNACIMCIEQDKGRDKQSMTVQLMNVWSCSFSQESLRM